jgi:hypothetical protein
VVQFHPAPTSSAQSSHNSPFRINWTGRSRSNGIRVHDRPEHATRRPIILPDQKSPITPHLAHLSARTARPPAWSHPHAKRSRRVSQRICSRTSSGRETAQRSPANASRWSSRGCGHACCWTSSRLITRRWACSSWTTWPAPSSAGPGRAFPLCAGPLGVVRSAVGARCRVRSCARRAA